MPANLTDYPAFGKPDGQMCKFLRRLDAALRQSGFQAVTAALLAAAAGYLAGAGQPAAALIPLSGVLALLVAQPRTAIKPVDPVPAVIIETPPDHIPLDALESAAFVISSDYAILAMNREAIEAFGRPQPQDDLRVAVRHPVVIEAVSVAVSQNRDVVREVEGVGRGPGIYRLRIMPMASGRLFLSFMDVSPARLAERMRVDFVANASHELRTPLATLAGFIETLQGPAANDSAARTRFLDVMASEAARMTRLIDDLLSLSRIELDKNIRPRETIGIQSVIEEIRAAFAVALEADGRDLRIQVDETLPRVVADRDQLIQVLQNLLSNALKYGRPGTPITLSVRQGESPHGAVLRFTVEDVGEGIPAEHVPRLTERFYRVDTGRSRRLGGTGLGLAIVKHIVERHRGVLGISSVEGKGTRVEFTIPVALSQN
jgi:two-component system phosphate regulon sensor histidine kinase PhoR